MSRLFCVALFLLVSAVVARAENFWGGHFKYQPNASFHPTESIGRRESSVTHGHIIDLRGNYLWRSDELEVRLHGEVLGDGGTSYELSRELQEIGLGGVGDLRDKRKLFDLSRELFEDSQFNLFSRLDRASVGWIGERLVTRVGREAISFGNGLAFQALDLFNPFSPTEIDKDYKPGVDLLYMQYLFASGDDLEFAFIPRRDPVTGDVKEDHFSYVLSARSSRLGDELEISLLTARHYDEWLGGLGVSQGVLGALFRSDFQILYDEEEDETVLTSIVNLDRSWVVSGYNLYTFIEYYRNGFGESRKRYQSPNHSLRERLQRGELFVQGRDLLALGSRIELTPLNNLTLSDIVHLNDGSGIFQIRIDSDLYQDLTIQTGVDLPYGPKGSEFGGVEVLPGEFLRPAKRVYVRISRFF